MYLFVQIFVVLTLKFCLFYPMAMGDKCITVLRKSRLIAEVLSLLQL